MVMPYPSSPLFSSSSSSSSSSRHRRSRRYHHLCFLSITLLSLQISITESHGKQHRVKAATRRVEYGEGHPLSQYLKRQEGIDRGGGEGEERRILITSPLADTDKNNENEEQWRRVETFGTNSAMPPDSRNGLKKSLASPILRFLDPTNITEDEIWSVTNTTEDEIWTTTGSPSNASNSTDTIPSDDTNSTFMEDLLSSPIKTPSAETNIFNATLQNLTDDHKFQPIRIRAVLTSESGGSHLSEWERYYLLDEILAPALQSWSQSLYVVPVVGNLIVDREQLYDKQSCGPGLDSGLPSPLVPEDHLETGVADTDLLVYVGLGFHPNETAGDEIPSNDNCTSLTNCTSPNHLPSCLSDPSILASATYCSTDQYDRPVAGSLHICIQSEMFYSPQRRRSNVVTVMHELGHVLGMNSHSIAHFRMRDGTPRTPRDESNDVLDVEVVCTGSEKKKEVVPLPDPSILSFRTVRNGIRVAELQTENVRLIARNQFNCQKLPGAELHSDSCLGEHWSRRLFREDLLNPILTGMESLRPSPLTLALFWDSGWYKVNLRAVGHVSGWGRRAGCDFAERNCRSSKQEEFCRVEGDVGCTPDLSHKAVCMMNEEEEDNRPVEFPFDDDDIADWTGTFPNAKNLDYCPTYVGYQNGMCNDPDNEAMLRVHPMEQFDLPNSRCLIGYMQRTRMALCVPIACVISDQSLRIRVDGIWQKCEYASQRIPAKGGGYVLCPDASRICPTFFCSRNCLGTNDGVCNYTSRECICEFDNAKGVVCGDDFAQREERIFETRLSQYYVANTTLLQDHPIYDDEQIKKKWRFFYNMSVKGIVLFGITIFALGIGMVAFAVYLFRQCKTRRKRQKDKMVASMLVDMRIHDPRRAMSRAARRRIDGGGGPFRTSKRPARKTPRPWRSNDAADQSFVSTAETAFSRTISETTTVEEVGDERDESKQRELENVCRGTGVIESQEDCEGGRHVFMDVELS